MDMKLQSEGQDACGGMYCEAVHKLKVTVSARHSALMHPHLKCCISFRSSHVLKLKFKKKDI